MNYLADKSYLVIKPQADAVTPIRPSIFLPLISESIRLNPNFAADRRMKGLSWKSDELLKGPLAVEGDLKLYADPDTLGHLLNMTYAKGSTTGNGTDGYTHPFTVGEGKSYTIEIPRGDYAQRFYGVRGENLKIEFEDNKMVATLSIKGLGQFNGASLAVALTGAGMTSLVLGTELSLRPTDGIKVNDVVTVGGVDLTITSVNADGITLGFASTTVTASVGDPVYLKAQTPSFGTIAEPLYLGNTLVGMADTSANADTAAAAKTTATPCYDIAFNLKNNLFAGLATGYEGPAVLLNQVREANLELSRLFETPLQYQKWIERVKQAATMIAKGRFIKSDFTTQEKLTVKFHKIKLMTNEEPLDVGQYIFSKQNFEALYDSSDAAAIDISLINRTAGTAY